MNRRIHTIALGVAVLLHIAAFSVAVLLRLPDPASLRRSVELRFRIERDTEASTEEPARRRERPRGELRQAPPVRTERATPPRPVHESRVDSRDGESIVRLPSAQEPADSVRTTRVMEIRSVLDRNMDAQEAWEALGTLLEQYPQFRESVVREMIAGAGLPPDSLPRVNLHLDRIFRNGIPPSWGKQREAVEQAFRSYDPVMGWTNKGGYGPTVNVIGLLMFLIDLIAGEK